MDISLLALLPAAVLADRLLEEPPSRIHPVCMMGSLALWLERCLRRGPNDKRMFWAGVLATFCVVGVSVATGTGLTLVAQSFGGPLTGWLIAMLLVYVCLAPSCLRNNALYVAQALEMQDLEEARKRVARIVGRNTASLDAHAVARACVESVAENVTDAVLSTLFWAGVGLLLFGGAGAAAFALMHRAANIMDALWGKKNEKYIRFGTAAAVLDDMLNFVPARLSLPCIVLASLVSHSFSTCDALRLGWRYRCAHASPNSAWSEAAFAGALHLKLGGPVAYGEQQMAYPWIGEGSLEALPRHIHHAVFLMWTTVIVFLLLESAMLMSLV